MSEKTKREPAPTVLRKLSDILSLSVEGIAQDLGISKSYAHQLRAGQQAIPQKLAWLIVLRYGVHPDSLQDEDAELLDCTGQPYSRESFTKHQEPEANPLRGVENVTHTLDRLFFAAAETGRLPLVLALLRDHVIRLLSELPELNRCFREQLARGMACPDEWAQRMRMKDQEPAKLITQNWCTPDFVMWTGKEVILVEAKRGANSDPAGFPPS